MSTLEDDLRKAVNNGFLHVSLSRRWDSKGLWSAGYRNTDNAVVRYVEHADPVVALQKAIRLGTKDATLPPSRPKKRADATTERRDREVEDLA